MKRFLLWAFVIVLLVIGGVLGVASMQPEDYRVERSIVINAPAALIFPLFSDFRKFPLWSPWEKLDPQMKKNFSGPATGVDSVYAWEGNSEVGTGRMTIVEQRENEMVRTRLDFIKPWESTCETIWSLTPEGNQTRMSWVMSGKNKDLMSKTFSLLMNMDKMVGKDFESGLNAIKNVAEGR